MARLRDSLSRRIRGPPPQPYQVCTNETSVGQAAHLHRRRSFPRPPQRQVEGGWTRTCSGEESWYRVGDYGDRRRAQKWKPLFKGPEYNLFFSKKKKRNAVPIHPIPAPGLLARWLTSTSEDDKRQCYKDHPSESFRMKYPLRLRTIWP